MEKKKNLLYLVLALAVALAVIAAVVFIPSKKAKKPSSQPASQAGQNYNPSVPENIKVPDKGATSTEKDVAVPNLQTQAAPGVEAQLRKFSVKAENNAFTPSKIIVYKGDTVHIEFSAIDKDYDFSIPAVYGISRQMKKGSKGPLEFQAYQAGQFDIICKACNNKKMGTLIVTPRK